MILAPPSATHSQGVSDYKRLKVWAKAHALGRFLGIALKSTSELEYHLIIARDIRAIGSNDFESLSAQAIEVRKLLHGLRNRVVASPKNAKKERPGVVN